MKVFKDLFKLWLVIVGFIATIAITVGCWTWCETTIIKDFTTELITKTIVGAVVPATIGYLWFLFLLWVVSTLYIDEP